MNNNWKQRLTKGWGLMRIIRMGLAVVVISEAVKNKEILFGALGGILLFQAIMDVGCCGTSGCTTNFDQTNETVDASSAKEITYEEVK